MYYYKIIKNGNLVCLESRNIKINFAYAPNYIEISQGEYETLLAEFRKDFEEVIDESVD